MPRRNRNVATVRSEPAPDMPRAMFSWSLEPPKYRKPSVKRRRYRLYGGEL